MARFLFETVGTDGDDRARAAALAARRYPEIEVAETYVVAPEGEAAVIWICRAPNVTHLRRWAAAAGLSIEPLRRIDADLTTGTPPPLDRPTNRGDQR